MSKTLKISFTPPDPVPLRYRVRYRVTGSTGAYSELLFPGDITSPILIENLNDAVDYEGYMQSECSAGNYSMPVPFSALSVSWVANTFTCEQDVLFGLDKEITGLSSPGALFFDGPLDTDPEGMTRTNHYWVADFDESSGNVYHFDPASLNTEADLTYVNSTPGVYYAVAADPQYRRLYFVGMNSGGLRVYHMDNNSWQTIPFGVDGQMFNRINLAVEGDFIYTGDSNQNTLVTIDRATLSNVVERAHNTIYGGDIVFHDFILKNRNGEHWIISAYNYSGDIHIYNSDFSNTADDLIVITLPGILDENNSSRYRQACYYDKDADRMYVSDAGSKNLYIIDCATRELLEVVRCTMDFGKTNILQVVQKDPITGELYINVQGYNAASDAAMKYKFYLMNKDTFALEAVYFDQFFTNLVREPGTRNIWGIASGLRAWDGGAYNTDGKIFKYVR